MSQNIVSSLSIIYDGHCAFCLRSRRVMERFDTFGALQFYDFHDAGTMAEKFPMISPEDAEEAMIAVTEELQIFKGFYAFRQIMWSSPWFWLFLPVFYFPGSSYVGNRLYAWIAKNRNHLGCRLSKP